MDDCACCGTAEEGTQVCDECWASVCENCIADGLCADCLMGEAFEELEA